MSIDTIIEVKTHKIKEQTETVQTCIQIKHYKNTLNSKIYVQLYLQMMGHCSRVMSQFKNNQKINIIHRLKTFIDTFKETDDAIKRFKGHKEFNFRIDFGANWCVSLSRISK
jgi:uncharacterized protein (UPF0371 family)